jgi:hypothetical protein
MPVTEMKLHDFSLFSVFGGNFDSTRLYYAYFQKVPSYKTVDNIDGGRIKKWLQKEGKDMVLAEHSMQRYDIESRNFKNTEAFYLLDNDMALCLKAEEVCILHNNQQENEAVAFAWQFRKYIKRSFKTQEISIVTSGFGGLKTTGLKIKKPKLDVAKHYNDDLSPLHRKILRSLKHKTSSGLFLFHGPPGTGKSTYIRYLVRSINKKVIFITPRLAGNFDAPEITNFLIDNANTVFVIEDAEELLLARDKNKNSSISMLLNLTDGLLGEALGIQIIATFNTELANIDPALLRKGRLTALYEFNSLCKEKSQTLLQELGIKDYFVSGPMTLAEIFNVKNDSYQYKKQDRAAIGFLSSAV